MTQIPGQTALAEAGNEVALWRPADLDAIKVILAGKRITKEP
jgi:hypothetical protein